MTKMNWERVRTEDRMVGKKPKATGFVAHYEGHCPACQSAIKVGRRVRYDDDGRLIHARCYGKQAQRI